MFVHELVKAKAHATPGAIAIQERQRQVTYRELQQEAVLLAECLNSFNLPVGAPVGLFVPRSADLAMGALGILQAGAAYVPLDPSDPRQRVEMALRDAGCRVVVVQRGLIDR